MTAVPIPITQYLLDSGCTTTVSNVTGHHWLIHPPACPDYRRALDALPDRGESLCSLQVRMSSRYVGVRPEWCIRGYFYLRSCSNLGPSHPAGYGQYKTLQECMDAALMWCRESPQYREATVHRRDLQEAGLI